MVGWPRVEFSAILAQHTATSRSPHVAPAEDRQLTSLPTKAPSRRRGETGTAFSARQKSRSCS
jgi:hypothetical protein